MLGTIQLSRTLGALEFIEDAATEDRAATYRERAAQMRSLARIEADFSLQVQLEELAARYEGLAASLEAKRF